MKLIRFVIQIAYFEDKSAILDYPRVLNTRHLFIIAPGVHSESKAHRQPVLMLFYLIFPGS